MHNILFNLLNSIPKNKWNSTIRKNTEYLNFLTSKYPSISSLNEKLWLFANNLDSPPTCAVNGCGNQVNWINNSHYSKTCSSSCANQLRKQDGSIYLIKSKQEQTMLNRYGVKNAAQSKNVQIKRLETMNKKYGQNVSELTREKAKNRSTDLNAKGRETLKSKYGVTNPINISGVKDKIKKTLLDNYGVTNPSQINDVKIKKQLKTKLTWDELSPNTSILDIEHPSVSLKNEYDNPNKRIQFTCNICNNVETLPSETYKFRIKQFNTPCSKCAKIYPNSSRAENLIKEYIKSLGIDIVENDKTVLCGKELDIYIPSLNIAIEYCGLYWHSENNILDKNYHNNKHTLCKKQNIRLITIFEDEWVNKQEIVKSRLSLILGKIQNKLMARKLSVNQISNKLANDFIDANHIQGKGATSKAWGLFHNDVLVSVMTISELNKAKGSNKQNNVWELNRFCSLQNYTIIGGANKLFNAMLKDINPDKIISYSDKRWNTGNVYRILGFDHMYDTRINYWYIDFKNLKRIHRYALRKNKNDNQLLTEWENRQLNGYTRIWDCGNSKWVWSKLKGV